MEYDGGFSPLSLNSLNLLHPIPWFGALTAWVVTWRLSPRMELWKQGNCMRNSLNLLARLLLSSVEKPKANIPGQIGHQCLVRCHPTAGSGIVPPCPEAALPHYFPLQRSLAEQPPPPLGCSARFHAPSLASPCCPCCPVFWWWPQIFWSFSHFERLCHRVQGWAWLWGRSCCCCCRWREEEGLCAWCGATWSGRQSRHSSTAQPGNCKERDVQGLSIAGPAVPASHLSTPTHCAPWCSCTFSGSWEGVWIH